MNENEIINEEKAIKAPRLSKDWLFCFNGICKMRESCFRYFASLNFLGNRELGRAVFPQNDCNDECKFYIEKRIERKAWGMNAMYENVAYFDARKIRKDLYDILGNKRGYYRYNSGEKWLSEEGQEMVREVFRLYGYEDVEFEHYVETYVYN